MTFRTIDDITRLANEKSPRFFSKGTRRFWQSRVSTVIHPYPGGAFFVTSEKNIDSPRRYTVRHMDLEGIISNFGDFQEYETASRAHSAARKAARARRDEHYQALMAAERAAEEAAAEEDMFDPDNGAPVHDYIKDPAFSLPSGEGALYSLEYLEKKHGRTHA